MDFLTGPAPLRHAYRVRKKDATNHRASCKAANLAFRRLLFIRLFQQTAMAWVNRRPPRILL